MTKTKKFKLRKKPKSKKNDDKTLKWKLEI